MPEALPVDREFVKALFLQGLKTSEISAKTGVNPRTIKTWSHRFGWTQIVSRVRQELGTASKQSLAVETAKDHAAKSKQLREIIGDDLLDQAQTLRNQPVKKASEIAGKDGRAATTLTIVKAASEVFGWSQDNNKSIINVAILGQLPDEPESLRNQSQVLEVETVEQELPSN